MVESLLKFITAENLFTHEDKILLAVSGGIDSMVMSQLFLNAGITFSIAHVNYNLRGADSINDKKFVTHWAEQHEIGIHIREVQAVEYESPESIQMKARTIRYEFFEALMSEHGFTKLATAHHLDDSFETVLLNLVKGTGPQGLKGIPIKNGNIIRPMMFATREEIIEYAATYEIKWREDISNSKTEYQRNLIRKEVTDVLKRINPSLSDTFRDTSMRLDAAAQIILNQKVQLLKEHLKEVGSTKELSTRWIQEDKPSLLLLSEIMNEYGFNFKQSKDLFKCIIDSQVGKIFHSNDFRINVDRNKLIILIAKKTSFEEIELSENEQNISIGEANLNFDFLDSVPDIDHNHDVALLDYDLIKWPLKIREWNEGDYFIPLGMKGKKRISDFLIDSKIPLMLKSKVLILESNADIVWVIGKRISDLYKITTETKRVLKISIHHAEVF
ncbi:MAG: tRNA(Ile)-lysidine synthase [Cyclobacteriaceae bacterium]|jgi:tRNA(Ile)-lysidine synthase